jgi:flagellar basal body P-ring formation protein FlgA
MAALKHFSIFSFCTFFLTFVSIQAFANTEEIEIRVLPESIVYQEYYTLGDIAELDGFDVETIQKLAKIRIGKSPLPGRSYLISRGTIQRKLKGKFDKNNLKIILPKKPTVSRASLKISSKQLENIVLKEIKGQFQNYEDVKITIKTKLKDIYIPKGKASYKIKRIGKNNKIGGYSSWMLTLMLDQKPAKKVLVRAKVDVFDNVLVAKGVIDKGSKIEKTDLIEVKKDISKEKIGFMAKNQQIVGQHARRDIFENESVRDRLVGRPIVVQKGMPVKVVFKSKNLMLSNTGKAMKSGRKGDVIPVRTLRSKKIVYTVVIDSKNVEVAL